MAAEPLADFYIRDEGLALRRTGSWLILAGFVVATMGIATLLFAMTTWSGYEAQGGIAVAIGAGLVAWGFSVLREGARRGPRLVPVPVSTAPARPRPPMGPWRPAPTPEFAPRVKVPAWHEPLRELRGDDRP